MLSYHICEMKVALNKYTSCGLCNIPLESFYFMTVQHAQSRTCYTSSMHCNNFVMHAEPISHNFPMPVVIPH